MWREPWLCSAAQTWLFHTISDVLEYLTWPSAAGQEACGWLIDPGWHQPVPYGCYEELKYWVDSTGWSLVWCQETNAGIYIWAMCSLESVESSSLDWLPQELSSNVGWQTINRRSYWDCLLGQTESLLRLHWAYLDRQTPEFRCLDLEQNLALYLVGYQFRLMHLLLSESLWGKKKLRSWKLRALKRTWSNTRYTTLRKAQKSHIASWTQACAVMLPPVLCWGKEDLLVYGDTWKIQLIVVFSNPENSRLLSAAWAKE